MGLKGTRNLKRDRNSRATWELTERACWCEPRRESKSETVALGLGFGLKKGREVAEVVVAKEAAPAREMEKRTANLRGSDEPIIGLLTSLPPYLSITYGHLTLLT